MTKLFAGDRLAELNGFTLEMAAVQLAGLELVKQEPGCAVTRFNVTEPISAGSGSLHGAVLYGLLDVTGFLAVLPMLATDKGVVTHDAHFSVLSQVPRGHDVELRADVERLGRSIAFIRVEAYDVSDSPERLLATAKVTKSVLDLSRRLKYAD